MKTLIKVLRAPLTLILSTMLLVILTVPNVQAQKEFTLDEHYELGQNASIHLKTGGAHVRILPTDAQQTSVKSVYRIDTKGLKIGSKDPVELEATVAGDSLILSEKEQKGTRIVLGGKSVEYNITIETPAHTNLFLRGEDNSYFVRKINGEINIKGKKASIDLQKCSGEKFVFDLNDSTLDMDEGAGSLTLKINKGVVRMQDINFEVMGVNVDKAELNMFTHLPDNGNYIMDIDDGKLLFHIIDGGGTITISHNGLRILSNGDFMVPLNSKKETIYKREGGSAQVAIDADKSRIKLETKEAVDADAKAGDGVE